MARWRMRRRESLAPRPVISPNLDAWQLPWRDLVAAARRFHVWGLPVWPAWPVAALHSAGCGASGD
eukprot:1153331-Alexandrium_andersonii.AAC.1